jgi:two-component system, NarL family, response regulator
MSEPTLIRVLVADDHLIIREGLVSILKNEADMLVVGEAATGLEAIALFRQHQPDITLMDLRMPELDGYDAIVQIRQEFSTARLIVLTTYDSEEDIFHSLRAGAMAYLLKDAPRQELLSTIRTVYAGHKHIPSNIGAKLAQRIDGAELSDREHEVLQLLAQGRSNRQISDLLGIAEGTVKSHVNSILHKLQVDDRTHAVVVALNRGIIKLSP